MFQKIMVTLGVLGLIVTFQNCGIAPSHSGSDLASATCNMKLQNTYKNTYYNVFRQQNRCGSCHAEGGQAGNARWFAAADLGVAFERFQSIGRTKVEQFAVGNHQLPYTGTELQSVITAARDTWLAAEDEAAACTGSMEVISSDKAIPSNVTTVTSLDSTAAWTTLSWDLDQEVRREALKGKIKAIISFEIRKVDAATDYFQVRNLTARITAPAEGSPAAVPVFTFQRLMIRSGGGPVSDFTAWRELNAGTNSTTGQLLLPGAGYFNLYVNSTDQLALNFEAILKGGTAITGGGGGGGGTTLPNITYRDLMDSAGPYGVFARNCISCHNATRSDGGLNMATYANSFAARSSIVTRVQNSNNPMPPGNFMSQSNRDIVQKWFDGGAPN